MQTHWFSSTFAYDGSQLASLFAYQMTGKLGPSIVSWQGPCKITTHMVDAEDQRAQSRIEGNEMLHFIIEVFHFTLAGTVALQRLLTCLVLDEMKRKTEGNWIREGDDIYLVETNVRKKLSISIATNSPVSQLIHFAVNVRNEGTPVPTCALSDVGLQPDVFARSIMDQFSQEFTSIVQASQKVHPVASYTPSLK